MISKWKKDAKNIEDAVSQKHKRLLKKIRLSTRHKNLSKQLHQRFATARSFLMSGFTLLPIKLTKKCMELTLLDCQKVWLLTLSRVTTLNYAETTEKNGQQVCMFASLTWYTTLREGLIKTGSHLPLHDRKSGRFTPERRFNVDQVPMPFAIDSKTTYEVNLSKAEKRDHRVWVTNPGSGLGKRQCTLQVCISPESKVRIAFIFRGYGKRISADKIRAYHPDVDVYWQEKAWADTKFSVEWVRQTLKEGIKPLEGKEFFLFCDSFTAQVNEEFLQAVRKINGINGN